MLSSNNFVVTFSNSNTMQCNFSAENTYEVKGRLAKMLLNGYKKEARPVLEYKDNVTITVGISLYLIKNLVSHP